MQHSRSMLRQEQQEPQTAPEFARAAGISGALAASQGVTAGPFAWLVAAITGVLAIAALFGTAFLLLAPSLEDVPVARSERAIARPVIPPVANETAAPATPP